MYVNSADGVVLHSMNYIFGNKPIVYWGIEMISDGVRLSAINNGADVSAVGIAVIVMLIVARGFFTLCESAVTEINDSAVKEFAEEKGSKKVLFDILEKPSSMITTFSANRILSAVLITFSALAVFFGTLSEKLGFVIERYSLPAGFASGLAAAIIILASVIAMTVFSDRIPKRIALAANSVSLAAAVAVPVKILIVLLTPLTALCGLLTKIFSLILGLSHSDEKDIATE